MKPALFIPLALIMATLASCRTQTPVTTTTSDVRYETRIEERLVTDTVWVDVPAQTASVVTPADTSHLETDYARSDAWVDSLGLLHHSLENKATKRAVEVQRPETKETTTATKTETKTVTKTEYVEKKLSAWQTFRLGAFPWLIAAVALLLIWMFRNPLWGLIQKIIKKNSV